MVSNTEKEGYKSAFKSTSIYGGVQLITIIIGIIKTKIAAVYLGTTGFGVLSMFTTTINLLTNFSNLGLSSSAVREISKKNTDSRNNVEVSSLAKAISRWVFISGLLGSLLMLVFSRKISLWTFNSEEYSFSYAMLSVVIVLTNMYLGQYALLQGLRKIKSMSLAKIIGSILGLLVIIPCYILGGTKGVVPSLILTSFLTLLVSYIYCKKLNLVRVKQSLRETFTLGKSALVLGLMLMLTAVMTSLTELITKSFITSFGSLSDVGLYQAGWALNGQYLGLVFTAMATDYFPRLTQCVNKRNNAKEVNRMVNQQAEIALLILLPLICIMLFCLPLIITVLYTEAFMLIIPMTKLLLLGSILKAASWAVSYLFLSAGDGKIYLINEIGIKTFNLPLYLLCYYWGGLTGIGYGFVINYSVYLLWVSIIAYRRYHFRHSFAFKKIFLRSIAFCLLIISFSYLDGVYYYLFSTPLVILAILFSLYELKARLNLNFYDYLIRKKHK